MNGFKERTGALDFDESVAEEVGAASEQANLDVGVASGQTAEDMATVSGTNNSQNELGRGRGGFHW